MSMTLTPAELRAIRERDALFPNDLSVNDGFHRAGYDRRALLRLVDQLTEALCAYESEHDNAQRRAGVLACGCPQCLKADAVLALVEDAEVPRG